MRRAFLTGLGIIEVAIAIAVVVIGLKLPSRSDKRQYDDQAPLKRRRFVAEQY